MPLSSSSNGQNIRSEVGGSGELSLLSTVPPNSRTVIIQQAPNAVNGERTVTVLLEDLPYLIQALQKARSTLEYEVCKTCGSRMSCEQFHANERMIAWRYICPQCGVIPSPIEGILNQPMGWFTITFGEQESVSPPSLDPLSLIIDEVYVPKSPDEGSDDGDCVYVSDPL